MSMYTGTEADEILASYRAEIDRITQQRDDARRVLAEVRTVALVTRTLSPLPAWDKVITLTGNVLESESPARGDGA